MRVKTLLFTLSIYFILFTLSILFIFIISYFFLYGAAATWHNLYMHDSKSQEWRVSQIQPQITQALPPTLSLKGYEQTKRCSSKHD